MFTTLFLVALFVTLFQTAIAQGQGDSVFTIDTPEVVQCQPIQLTWTSTSYPPYDILIVRADDVCGYAIEDLGYINSTFLTWTPNIGAGTAVVLSLQDSAGNEAWSGNITIGNSNDTSCLPSTSTVSSTSTTHTSPSPTSSISVAGAANAGFGQSSGAFPTHPLNAAALVGSAILAVVVSAL